MNPLTTDDLKTLSAPFPKESTSVKVQSLSRNKDKAMLVLYLQHTDVYARIEEVDPAWSLTVTSEKRHEDVNDRGEVKGSYFSVGVRMTIKGVSRENYGEGDDPKGAISDAVKRAAMLFGVGRYLYDSEQVWVPYNEDRDRYRHFTLDEYNAALRPGQTRTPTADSGGGAVAPGKKAGPAVTPKTTASAPTAGAPVSGGASVCGPEHVAQLKKLQDDCGWSNGATKIALWKLCGQERLGAVKTKQFATLLRFIETFRGKEAEGLRELLGAAQSDEEAQMDFVNSRLATASEDSFAAQQGTRL